MKLVTFGNRSQRTLAGLQRTAGIGTRTILVSGTGEILVRLVRSSRGAALLIWLVVGG